MKRKPLAHYLDLIKSAGDRQEWLIAKRYGETALKKLTRLTYSPLEEYLLYYRLGYVYDQITDYSRSLDFFYKAHLTASKNNLKESYIAHAIDMIGTSFLRIKNIDQALTQFNKVDEYYQKHGYNTEPMNKERFIRHLMDFGYCHLYKNDLEKAGEIIEKKLTTYMPFTTKSLSASYYHINGEYLIAVKDYKKARESINEFLTLRREANSTRDVFEGKIHLAVIDLLEGKLDLAIKGLLSILKEAGREKQNDFICIAGLLLSKCYSLKSLPDKAANIERRIKPILNKLDITWMYEQIRDFEQLFEQLKLIYRNDNITPIPRVLVDSFSRHKEDLPYKNRIIGESLLMQEIYQLIGKIASTDLPVLIQGETGTGKELVARTIHLNSLRRQKPWLALNCASVTETLLENELFGHAKGAFTDAKEDRKGYIESASEGTLFLDEIAEMSPNMQQKLLRVMDEKLIWRVGASKPIPVNTRFIFASNQNIEELVKHKRFREDLFYRINTIVITLPPLRDRKEDIPLLVQHFLDKYASPSPPIPPRREEGRERGIKISPDALGFLMTYTWPGNIRELENEIKRIYALHPKVQIITESMVSELIRKGNKIVISAGNNLKDLTEDFQRKTIEQTIIKCRSNLSEVARLLGYDRANLNRKIRQLNIILPKP